MESQDEEIVRSAVTVVDRRRRTLLRVVGMVVVVLLVGSFTAGIASYLTLKASAQDSTELAQQIQKACSMTATPDPDLAQFCPKADQVVNSAPSQIKSDPVPGPPGPTGSSGAQGPQGPGPTVVQIQAAVRSYCSISGSCRGPRGLTPTTAQVVAAVTVYCSNNNRCQGPSGASGKDGANGQNGSDGVNGTEGKDGKDGAPGPQGPPGVVNVIDNCDTAPDGQVVGDVNASYDAATQTVTLSCTYKDDQQVPPAP